MKLAEALARRAELTTRFNELQNRAIQSARHQDGDEPAEDPNALLEESDRVAAELEHLITQINATNLRTELEAGVTMTDALARRDVLRLRRRIRDEVAQAGLARGDRWTRSEIKMVSAVDVAQLRSETDDLAAELRGLDTRIQQVNWTAELVE